MPRDPTLVLLTVEEAARRLRVGRTTCYRRAEQAEKDPRGYVRQQYAHRAREHGPSPPARRITAGQRSVPAFLRGCWG
ncbi:hypothetical protein [Streptomyces sp. NPDC096012]|uniref:hypothetical protein n=1 Tax=Streptomyces sp. NPDC096012 TaxID=3155684 RepID=UPI00336A8CD4